MSFTLNLRVMYSVTRWLLVGYSWLLSVLRTIVFINNILIFIYFLDAVVNLGVLYTWRGKHVTLRGFFMTQEKQLSVTTINLIFGVYVYHSSRQYGITGALLYETA